MRILLCGHTSFAAQGLVPHLKNAGHDVVCFGRGPVATANGIVTGPIHEMHLNPHLAGPWDTVLNYIVLKDELVQPNLAYIDSIIAFCRKETVRHLIHISSVSAYKASAKLVNEDAEVETDHNKKGTYGSLKSSTDIQLTSADLGSTKLSMVRPGFILGKYVPNPIIGTAVRTANKLMVIGSPKSEMPVLSRETMHQAIRKLVENPPTEAKESLVFSSSHSPSRLKFLEVCCQRLGAGLGVKKYPKPLWWTLAVGAEAVARLIGRKELKPYSSLTARTVKQHFDATKTEKRLGVNFDVDWETELVNAVEGQEQNFTLPYTPKPIPTLNAKSAVLFGYGRIVKQKHLPWLKKLGFSGPIQVFDLAPRTDADTGQEIKSFKDAKGVDADLIVVATPGPAHIDALQYLEGAKGPMVVEKPIVSRVEHLDAWVNFAKSRKAPTLVCHNYRFRDNVRKMMDVMSRYNPGRFIHAQLHFAVAPVALDGAVWMRSERKSRTLLVEYSCHFTDLAMMFGTGAWKVESVKHELDGSGNTSYVSGHLAASNGTMSFMLRQGFGPKRCRIYYTFQNYSISLGFYPDTFVVHMSDDFMALYKAEAKASWKASKQKVYDKLLGKDKDQSHGIILADATQPTLDMCAGITVEKLEPSYRALLEMADRVY